MSNRTKRAIISRMYYAQKLNSERRGHNPPGYTRNELYFWLINNPDFDTLYNRWVESGYNRWLIPSVDRLDDNKGYTFDNIQLITWKENHKNYHGEGKQGIRILVYDDEHIYIYPTIFSAAKDLNLDVSNMRHVIAGRGKTVKGYKLITLWNRIM